MAPATTLENVPAKLKVVPVTSGKFVLALILKVPSGELSVGPSGPSTSVT